MKRAKSITAALVIFAFVGSALAFKAHFGTGTLYCTSTQGATCPQIANYDPDVSSNTELFCESDPGPGVSCNTKRKVKRVID